jgi:hypothetical protein
MLEQFNKFFIENQYSYQRKEDRKATGNQF